MENITEQIRKELKSIASDETRKSSLNFFKEKINNYGVRVPVVNQLSKTYLKKIKTASKSEIFKLCEQLWKSGYLEEAFVACNWSYFIREKFEPQDFETFENWINNYITNWATCDTFCNHTVGALLEMYPEKVNKLRNLAKSENRWVRRASAVSLIIPAKKGLFLNDVFEIANILLLDEDDIVQKGCGWMLKIASQPYQQEVFDYIMKNKSVMPRTSLRYAIEKMPRELKKIAMAK